MIPPVASLPPTPPAAAAPQTASAGDEPSRAPASGGPRDITAQPAEPPYPAAIAAAKQALAVAASLVVQDRLDHQTACVAADERLVQQAQLELIEAKDIAPPSGILLNVTL